MTFDLRDEHTLTEKLEFWRNYWLEGENGLWETPDGQPYRPQVVAKIDAAIAAGDPMTQKEWLAYFTALDAILSENDSHCDGKDMAQSKEALAELGLTEKTESVLRLVDIFGGHCTHEILWNAMEWLLEDAVFLEDAAELVAIK